MCKTCAHAVHTVRTSSGRVYNLCAAQALFVGRGVCKRPASPTYTRFHTPYLSTQKMTTLHLLQTMLYTLSTPPIINTIIYKGRKPGVIV